MLIPSSSGIHPCPPGALFQSHSLILDPLYQRLPAFPRIPIYPSTLYRATSSTMPATPPADHTLAWASPDDILADTASLTRSTPLSFTMTGTGSDISSPSDFAFEPRAIPSDSPFEPYKADKTANYPPYTPNSYTNPAYNVPQYGYSSASPFSSTSGSATGSSFSSADALPAISRNFVRPSPTETRRPATAGGALQSRSPFVGYMGGDGTRFRRLNQRSAAVTAEDGKAQRFTETIDEAGEGVFANPNPFASPSEEDNDKQVPLQNVVDPRFIPGHRRASEPHFATINQQPSWSQAYTASPISQFPLNSMSAQASQYNSAMNMQHHIQQLQRAIPNLSSRPQTSDGLPSYSGVVSLPSARTIVNQIDGFTPQTHFVQRQDDKTMQPASLMPFRDARAASVGTSPLSQSNLSRAYSIDSSKTARPSHVSRSSARNGETDSQGEMTFVPLGGPAPKKRPRRRFDEIERLYTCGWDGCEKAYGTLNHLNAHVAMQKHGEKRLPSGECSI